MNETGLHCQTAGVRHHLFSFRAIVSSRREKQKSTVGDKSGLCHGTEGDGTGRESPKDPLQE